MNEYMVVVPFEYDGKQLAQGDTWEPAGFRNDSKIIESGTLVRPFAQAARLREKTQRTQSTQKSVAVVEDRDAEAYHLYHEEGLTLEEAGNQLGIAASTVSRAIKRHAERMEDDNAS